jgi:hypothetical protein
MNVSLTVAGDFVLDAPFERGIDYHHRRKPGAARAFESAPGKA